jgi:hypothetical protein
VYQGLDLVLSRQFIRQRLQTISSPGYEVQVEATAGQIPGDVFADAP